MRITSIFGAVIVCLGLYLFVMQREALYSLAASDTVESTSDTPENEASRVQANAAISVVVMESHAREIQNALVLRGETEPTRQVDKLAETSGQMLDEPRRRGSFVEEGDVLCRLDPGTRPAILAEAEARLAEAESRRPEATARVAEAEALLLEAQINDRAASQLGERGFASETRVANARAGISSALAAIESAEAGLSSLEAQIESAQAAVAAAQEEIDRLLIRAPFHGILVEDAAEKGALLQPGALCASIMQLDPIRLTGFLPETQVDLVSEGARAEARLVNGKILEGTLDYIAQSADQTTRTFRVEIDVPNPDFQIRAGQTVEIKIDSAGKEAHLLPGSALTLNDSGALGVRVVEDQNIAGFRPVTVLRDAPEGVWVSGLNESELVIVIGQEFVRAGVPIVPTLMEGI